MFGRLLVGPWATRIIVMALSASEDLEAFEAVIKSRPLKFTYSPTENRKVEVGNRKLATELEELPPNLNFGIGKRKTIIKVGTKLWQLQFGNRNLEIDI